MNPCAGVWEGKGETLPHLSVRAVSTSEHRTVAVDDGCALQRLPCPFCACEGTPVSYTHLDVYKRQGHIDRLCVNQSFVDQAVCLTL